MKYVVYEIWTGYKIIEADDMKTAYTKGEPKKGATALHLSNWHAVPLENKDE